MAAPNFTQNVTPTNLTSPQSLAKGNVASGQLDLRTYFGAWVSVQLGRNGTTAITNSLTVRIRRIDNDGSLSGTVGAARAPVVTVTSSTTAANSTTVNVTSNNGQNVLQVASVTGFAAGNNIMVAASADNITRLEFHTVSKVSGSTLVLDRNLDNTHTSGQADVVTNQADFFQAIWLDGGALYEIIFDYGAEASAQNFTLLCEAQTLTSIA